MKLKIYAKESRFYRISRGRTYLLQLLFAFFLTVNVQSQQEAQYTQYMYNTQVINPAYVGTRGTLNFALLYRTQWIGLDGAPETISFSMGSPIGRYREAGLGMTFFRDALGPLDESGLAVDFSHTIRLNRYVRLVFGIKGGINLFNVDFNRLNIFNPTDQSFISDLENRLNPVFGSGVYLHNNETWYVGISAPNLLSTTRLDRLTSATTIEEVTFFGIMGYVLHINDNMKLKPAILGRYISGAPFGLDLSANFLFNDKFTLGASYRWDAAMSGLASFQVSKGMMIGYAYDFGLQRLANFNSGSHEIFLRIELASRRQMLTPRFF